MAGGTVVGLDIGSRMMKAVEMKRSGSRMEVTALGVAPTPEDTFESGQVLDPVTLGQAVKALLKSSGITAKKCVSSVSGLNGVVVRVIEVDKMEPSEMSEAIVWEAERHVPFSLNESVMDWAPLDRPDGPSTEDKMDVILAVAQLDMVDRHIETIAKAGLKASAIDVEPLAIGRALLELGGANPAGSRPVAIVSIGASLMDITIFTDGLPTLTRVIPVAGDQLTDAISQALGVDRDTAERYKTEQGKVLTDYVAPATTGFSGTGEAGGPGFVDFTAPQTSQQSATSSGRMPFDFSTPGETEGEGEPSGSLPSADSGSLGQESPQVAGSLSGNLDPSLAAGAPGSDTGPHEAEPGFFTAPDAAAAKVPATTAGASSQLQEQIHGAMVQIISEIANEIRRSIDAHNTRPGAPPVERVLVCGGTALLPNLCDRLHVELNMPVALADPLHLVTVSARNYSAEHMTEIAPMFPGSIGLCAYALLPAPPKPKVPKPKKKKS